MEMDKAGYQMDEKLKGKRIKEVIMKVLEENKRGYGTDKKLMNIVRSNIEKCDHHDLVRIDQILTRNKNEKSDDEEFQWGSVVMNCKWRIPK